MCVSIGKAPSDIPTLKPYWGKLTVRNFREGDGNVGIIRSPLRAIALPDRSALKDTYEITRGVIPTIPNLELAGK